MPNKSTVKLISAEGFEFIIDYKAACVSNTIRNMLSSQGAFAAKLSSQLGSCTGVLSAVMAEPEQQRQPGAVREPDGHFRSLSLAPLSRAPPPLNTTHNKKTGSFTETELGEVKFPEISTHVLEKVCQYFYYKLRYQNR